MSELGIIPSDLSPSELIQWLNINLVEPLNWRFDGNIGTPQLKSAGLMTNLLMPIVDDRDSALTFSPAAQSTDAAGAWYQFTNDSAYYAGTVTRGKGDLAATQTVKYRFTGTYIAVVSWKSTDAGQISVSIDGKAPETVDLYASVSQRIDVWEANLPLGSHEITVTCLNAKNASSTNYYFYFDGFRIAPPITDSLLDEVKASYSVVVATDASGRALYDAANMAPAGYVSKHVAGVYVMTSSVATVDACPSGRYVDIRNGPISGTVTIGVYLSVARK